MTDEPGAGDVYIDAPFSDALTIGVVVDHDQPNSARLVGFMVGPVRIHWTAAEARAIADAILTAADNVEHPGPLNPEWGAAENDLAGMARAAEAWKRAQS